MSQDVIVDALPDRAVESFAAAVLPPAGVLQFPDTANGNGVAEEAMRQIDLGTGDRRCLPCAGRTEVLGDVGFTDIEFGPPIDTFGGGSDGAQRPDLRRPRLPLHRPRAIVTVPMTSALRDP